MRSKKAERGFTLVEALIVLVVLAILAAIIIPAFVKYIDKANRASVIVECRAAVTAGQGLYSEAYAARGSVENQAIETLAEVPGAVSGVEIDASYTILHLTYTRAPYTVTYCRAPSECAKHGEVFNFEDGGQSGGGSLDPDKGFAVGDYVINVAGSMDGILNSSFPAGMVYYYNGAYYYSRNPGYLDNLNHITGNGNMIKINHDAIVQQPNNARAGDLALINGQLQICIENYWQPVWKPIDAAWQ